MSTELESWAEAADISRHPAGVTVREAGQSSHGVILLLEGTMEALLDDNGTLAPVSDHVAPTWIGAIPTLMETPLGVTLRARTQVRLATIAPDAFVELTLAHRPVLRRVLAQVRPVIGRITQMEQNRERLASLGTMAAGLAHELNNPATAAQRAADDLAKALEVLSSTIGAFVESGLERAEAERLVDLQRQALAVADQPDVGELERADAIDELSDCLDEAGVRSTGNLSSRWPPPASTEPSWTRSERSPAPPPRPPSAGSPRRCRRASSPPSSPSRPSA